MQIWMFAEAQPIAYSAFRAAKAVYESQFNTYFDERSYGTALVSLRHTALIHGGSIAGVRESRRYSKCLHEAEFRMRFASPGTRGGRKAMLVLLAISVARAIIALDKLHIDGLDTARFRQEYADFVRSCGWLEDLWAHLTPPKRSYPRRAAAAAQYAGELAEREKRSLRAAALGLAPASTSG